MASFLVDTDIFIDHLRGRKELRTTSRDQISYSVVTRAELFSGNETEEDAIELLLGPFREIEVSRKVAELAGRIRQTHKTRMPDALIAATAIVEKLALRTRNLRDFQSIPALRIKAPH